MPETQNNRDDSNSGRRGRRTAWLAALALGSTLASSPLAAQSASMDLTLETMVELTLSSSYRVRYLNMSVEQTRQRLRAENARLRSSVSLNMIIPTFRQVSEQRYNNTLGVDETVMTNSRRWEATLSVRQPVIIPFLGYPTNGYLSLNNRLYRDTQVNAAGVDRLTHYNRYFVQYTQPLFQPNSLKNNLDRAELDYQSEEISFRSDVLNIVNQASNEYFQLFDNAYQQSISQEYIRNLVRAETLAQGLVAGNPARSIELDQIRVELANTRQTLDRQQSDFRLETASLKTQVNIPESTAIVMNPVIVLSPVQVDMALATRLAIDEGPRLRNLAIQQRRNEIQLEQTRGQNGFSMDLQFSYGREKDHEQFSQIWGEPRNTYTVNVQASVPIWDWGERDARIQAQQINLTRTELQVEEAQTQIVSNVENEVRNVEERQGRVLTMNDNLALSRSIAEESLNLYGNGTIGVQDLLSNLRRQNDTARNFLQAYMGWQQSLRRLQTLTYYDFEYDMPVLDRFGIDVQSMRQVR